MTNLFMIYSPRKKNSYTQAMEKIIFRAEKHFIYFELNIYIIINTFLAGSGRAQVRLDFKSVHALRVSLVRILLDLG